MAQLPMKFSKRWSYYGCLFVKENVRKMVRLVAPFRYLYDVGGNMFTKTLRRTFKYSALQLPTYMSVLVELASSIITSIFQEWSAIWAEGVQKVASMSRFHQMGAEGTKYWNENGARSVFFWKIGKLIWT